MSENKSKKTGQNDGSFDEKIKGFLNDLKGEASRQKSVKETLFRLVFSDNEINQSIDAMINVALGSVAKHIYLSTEDGHPSQVAAFEALAGVKVHWQRACNQREGKTSTPPLSFFRELRGIEDEE